MIAEMEEREERTSNLPIETDTAAISTKKARLKKGKTKNKKEQKT